MYKIKQVLYNFVTVQSTTYFLIIFGKFEPSKAKTMVSMINKIWLYLIITYLDKEEEVRLTLKLL